MSLQNRLIVWFALLVLIGGGLGLFGLRAAHRLGDLAIAVYDQPLMTINYSRAAAQKFARLAANPDGVNLGEAVRDIEGDLAVVDQRSRDRDIAANLNAALTALHSWLAAPSEEKRGLAEATLGRFDDVVESAVAAGYLYRVSAVTQIDSAKRELTIGIAGAALLGLLLAFGVARQVAWPIRRAAETLERLAGGEVDVQIDQAGSQMRELAMLLRSIASFRQSSARLAALQASRAEEERASAAQRRADLTRIADDYEATVTRLIAHVGDSAAHLAAQSETVAVSAETSLGESGRVAGAAQTAAVLVENVASAMADLSGSIERIDAEVGNTAQTAYRAAERVRAAKESVRELAARATRIQEVTVLINRVARTINMLSLNATVEASRAGAAGRGFAVVATEVKQLAGDTATASSEIEALARQIDEASANVVSAIGGIEEAVSSVERSASSIADAAQRQTAAGATINAGMTRLSESSEEVMRSIAVVTRHAETTRGCSEEAAKAGRDLAVAFERLDRESDCFLRQVKG